MALELKVTKAIFHWYSGPEDVLADILKQGYLISAAPSAEYSPEHRRAIRAAPLEKLLIETDTPVVYKPLSGRYASEPKDVLRTLRAVAEIKEIDQTQVAEQTHANTIKFFELAG